MGASYVLVKPKRLSPCMLRIGGEDILIIGQRRMEKHNTIMYKAGRPKKAIKKDQLLAIKCTLPEREIIKAKAKQVDLTVSEYLRQNGLNGKIDRPKKGIPKEVLQLTGTLNHLAANLNQIAKKRNGFDEINAMDRALLEVQSRDLKNLAITIKNYLQ